MYLLPLPKKFRFYYHHIKFIVNNKQSFSKLAKLHCYLNLACYLYLFLRVVNHLAMFASNFRYGFWKVDYYAAYGYYYPNEYNATLALIINNAVIFGIICQLILYFSDIEVFAWKEMSDLVVLNVDNYFDCIKNVHTKKESFKIFANNKLTNFQLAFLSNIKTWSTLKTFLHNWWSFSHINKNKLINLRLVFFPNLNLESRIWLLRLLDCVELYYPIFIFTYSKQKIFQNF